MCGIVGYVGPRDCSDVLVSALTRLEYRGYDSAGIAVFENGKIEVAKTKGRLKDLSEKMEREGKPLGHAGIGHTRWATHGQPSDINSHPHSGKRVTIVHNGIIENYIELKEYLLKKLKEKSSRAKSDNVCPYAKKCGGCDYQGVEYKEQLKTKQAYMKKLLKPFCFVEPIVGMKNPLYYRHKVHAAFDCTRRGQIVAGAYRKNTHDVVDIESCMIEEQESDEIIRDIKDMLRSFRIKTYDEDTGYGLLRHVLVRKGYATGQIMVVLVLASPILPSKNNFVKALRKKHPNITTVVLNVNDKKTSMVLGDRNITLYGKGFIEDKLCGCTFRISPGSFYQVNPVQTELLYEKAIHEAHLTGKERVIDAYCGTGTIGIIAAKNAGEVIGVELNRDAIRDAVTNAKRNDIRNIRFYNDDAGKFMVEMAQKGEKADVVIMDPPRTGSDEAFLSSVVKLAPERVVYVSCGPETLARDLKYLTKHGYTVKRATPYDCFPYTEHIETVVLLCR